MRERERERERRSRTRARTTRWSGETARESDGRSDECGSSEPLWFTLNGSLARTDAAWLEPWLAPSCGFVLYFSCHVGLHVRLRFQWMGPRDFFFCLLFLEKIISSNAPFVST
jgi:hypothetical protein